MKQSNKFQKLFYLSIIPLFIITLFFAGSWRAVLYSKQAKQAELQRLAQIISVVADINTLATELKAEKSDSQDSSYQQLKESLFRLININRQLSRIAILSLKHNKLFYQTETRRSDFSSNPFSLNLAQPGQAYTLDNQDLWLTINARAARNGYVTQDDGRRYLAAYLPIIDRDSGQTDAILIIEEPYAYFYLAAWAGLLPQLLAALGLLSLYILLVQKPAQVPAETDLTIHYAK